MEQMWEQFCTWFCYLKNLFRQKEQCSQSEDNEIKLNIALQIKYMYSNKYVNGLSAIHPHQSIVGYSVCIMPKDILTHTFIAGFGKSPPLVCTVDQIFLLAIGQTSAKMLRQLDRPDKMRKNRIPPTKGQNPSHQHLCTSAPSTLFPFYPPVCGLKIQQQQQNIKKLKICI